jgi:GMP synthase-like glutamine amidotransferase
MHADQDGEHPWLRGEKALLRELLASATPTLGVCLGAQVLADVGGGVVTPMAAPEIGWASVELTPEGRVDPLLDALPESFDAFQWHSYEFSPPANASVLARSVACMQAFRLETAPSWGIQFHAEVTSETIAGWIDDYRSDEDAVRAELDWEALQSETERRIAGWNELGTGICRRFLERAAGLAGS